MDVMTEIIDVKGREILDSRGNPTVEVDLTRRCPPEHPPAPARLWNCATNEPRGMVERA
jgi:hypothetical protein